jgi:hypothetical protein
MQPHGTLDDLVVHGDAVARLEPTICGEPEGRPGRVTH